MSTEHKNFFLLLFTEQKQRTMQVLNISVNMSSGEKEKEKKNTQLKSLAPSSSG